MSNLIVLRESRNIIKNSKTGHQILQNILLSPSKSISGTISKLLT